MAHGRFFKLGWWLILMVMAGGVFPAMAQEGSTGLQPDNLDAVGVLNIFRPEATVVKMQFTPDSTRLIWLEQLPGADLGYGHVRAGFDHSRLSDRGYRGEPGGNAAGAGRE
jgi:hypothetical protein